MFYENGNTAFIDNNTSHANAKWNIVSDANGYRLDMPNKSGKYFGVHGTNLVSASLAFTWSDFGDTNPDKWIYWQFVPESEASSIKASAALYFARLALYNELVKAESEGVSTVDASAVYTNTNATSTELNSATTALHQARIDYRSSLASETNPQDLTDLVVVNPDFSTLDATGWTRTQTSVGNQQFGTGAMESWNNNNVSVLQTLTNLANGKYRVSCDMISGNDGRTAYVYAKGMTEVNGEHVNAQSSAGNYTTMSNEVAGKTISAYPVIVGDHTMTIGFKDPSGWVVVDNFKVIYYGPDLTALKEALQAQIDAVPALQGTTTTAAYNAAKNYADGIDMDALTTEEAISTASSELSSLVDAAKALQSIYARFTAIKNAALAIAANVTVPDVESATTADAIDTAIPTLRANFLAVLPNVTIPADPGYIDVTAVMVDNAGVHTSTDYWTKEGTPNGGYSFGVCNYGECEFYNCNFKFYQTLALSRGTWEFGVTGFHRAGNHNTYFYAGGSKVLIPGVESSVVNDMAGAKTYFDNGNGKVSVKFALDAAGNVEIGIDNQDTETDKWTIFRDFTLKYFGEAVDLSAYVTQLAEAVAKAEAVNGTVPAAVYSSLSDVVSENNKTSYTTVAEYETAINNIETATNNAKAIAVPYTEYKAVKAKVEAMKSVEGYTETTSEATNTLTSAISDADAAVEAATTAEAIADQVAAIKAAGKTFIGGVRSDGAHPFDITFLITNPSFDNNNADGWTCNPAPGFQSYTNCEYYAGNTRTFDIYQTLTSMPKGNYELKVQAFQRTGWFRPTLPVSSVIYINKGQTTIKALTDEGATDADHQWHNGNDSHDDTGYYPNSMRGAAAAFAAGFYWNTVLTAVEGELKFGFKSTADAADGGWTIFDNFQLYYYGNSINVAMDEAEKFSALADIEGANVTMVRNTKEGFNTVALPFDLTNDKVKEFFGEGAIVYEYSDGGDDADHVTINFNKKAENTIEANVPVLVKSTKAVNEIAVDDVVVKTGEAKVEGTYFDFVGNYAGQITLAEGDYFIGSGAVYKSEDPTIHATTIKGFRAYIKAKSAGVKAIKLFIDGQPFDYETAVNGIEAAPAQNGAIYNIAGQRVSKAQKGIFIVNGKKVVK